MHKKLTPFIFLSFAIGVSALASVAHAQPSIGALVDTSGYLGYDSRDHTSSSTHEATTTNNEPESATTSARIGAADRAISASVSGQLIAHAHRSTVTTFAQSLLAVADSEGELGAQLRTIAEAQKNAEATTTEAIQKVATRGSLKTFFAGGDTTSLGILRNGIRTTQNHLNQLNNILARTTDATVRATLSEHISALARDQATIQRFVNAHENSFGFLNWLAELF